MNRTSRIFLTLAVAAAVAAAPAHADLDAETAERYLDDLCRRDLAEHRVTEDGDVFYRFPDAPSALAKRAAKGVLDD